MRSNKFKIQGLLAAMIMFAATTSAQTVDISPKPQSVEWGTVKAFDNSVNYTLTGESDADVDAINLFKKNFGTQNGDIEVVIGERGDKAVEQYESLIPEKNEGYYLNVSKNKVVIAGNDGAGTFYGVQSFIQIASQPQVMSVTITDYPSISDRGLVEGFYGNPYSEANRYDLFDFFGRQKMNVYIYGPKDDVYHKGKWREPYPEAEGRKIAEYAAAAKANKVDFVWAIHPGVDIQWNKTDSVNIVNKLKKMYDLGIRTFAVFFDDIWGEGTKPENQAGLMNYITDELKKVYDDVNPLIMCPTQYNKGWTSGNYLSILGTQMYKDVRIMWTGNSVVDMIEMNDMTWINNQIGRKAYIWLNYPVTDYCINHMLMGPTWGNGLDIASTLGGFTSNPMEYAMASKVSLYSIGDYCWNMENYDADASWKAAIKYLMPENASAFHFFCENNVDLGPNTHGLRRTDESPRFVKAKELYSTKLAEGDTVAAVAAIEEHFNLFINVADTLLGTDEAPEMIEEIEGWLKVMKFMGQKGLCITDMYNALLAQNPDSFINSYLRYLDINTAQEEVKVRDFEGSLKSAKPEVATYHVAPFIKSTVSSLISEYKSKYNYRTDVFPAQLLENGTYLIKYNGKYITNATPNTAGSPAKLVAGRDTIRPQRQEWFISLDPETNRYKIVNAEDERYLNENGRFSNNNSTNPYDAAWHTYNITRLANGKFAIQNGGSAGNNFWLINLLNMQIKKSETTNAIPDYYIFDIVPIGGEENISVIDTEQLYYIKDGERYLTNTNVGGSGGTPVFRIVNNPGDAQLWKFTQDANADKLYKITSHADGRYINEYAVFGSNAYYPDWNTYLILMMDGKFSIQTTQEAGTHFWNINGNRLEQDGNIELSTSFVIEIVPQNQSTEIDNVDSKKNIDIVNGRIILQEPVERISLFNIGGENIRRVENTETLRIDNIDDGTYIVVIYNENQVQALKIHI